MQTATTPEAFLEILAQLLAELHPEAASRLEKAFAVRLPEKVLTTAETPRDVLRHLASAAPEEAAGLHRRPADFGTARQAAKVHTAVTLVDVLEQHARVHLDAGHRVSRYFSFFGLTSGTLLPLFRVQENTYPQIRR